MKPLLLLGLLFLSTANANAGYNATSKADCSPVDFRETFPMKMRNQHGISWCFAHAASDYLQFTYKIPEQISAADVAINYYQGGIPKIVGFFKRLFSHDARTEPPQTGFIAIAVKRIQSQGYCPESVFPSELWTKVSVTDNTRTQEELIPAIEEMWDLQKQVQGGQIATANDLPWFLEFQNVDQSSFYSLLKNNKKANLLNALRIAACNGYRKPFPSAPVKAHFDLNGPKFFQKMNASFNAGMPVTIDFYSSVFENYDNYKKSLGELHTVLIYGRKYDETAQQCTYLMKNSYGDKCETAAPGDNGHWYDPRIKCEGGYLWFTESKMHEMMLSRLILERK